MNLNQILVSKNKMIPIEKQILKDERKPVKIKEKLASRKLIYIISVAIVLFLAWLLNVIVNYISGIVENVRKTINTIPGEGIDKIQSGFFKILDNFSNFFLNHINTKNEIYELIFRPNQYILIWLFLLMFFSLLSLKKVHAFYKRNRKLNYGQKGNDKFATVKELKKQYKAVPQQTHEYQGDPGVPMTHINDLPKIFQRKPFINFVYNGKFLIDTATVNTMVIGTSRSGKGESLVFPATDIDTRAENKPSLVFADPKGELYAGSYETLRKRGYDVEVLNLLNPDDGMSYNMLEIVKEEYLKGDFATAEQYCVNLTKTLFPGDGSDPFWDNAAASLVNALIFTVIHRALQENRPERITMRNVVDLLNTLGPETENEEDEDGNSINQLDKYIMSMPEGSLARKQYATSSFSSGNTRGSIFTTASERLTIFTSEKLSKMGSANSVDFTRVGFNKRLRLQFEKKYIYKRGRIHYGYGKKDAIVNNFKIDSLGYMENNFKRKMQDGENILVEILDAYENEAGLIDYKVIETFEFIFYREQPSRGFTKKKHKKDPYTGEIIYPKTAFLKNNSENIDGIKGYKCFYSERPIAIFMVVPDYDSSIHVVSALFVSQLYTMLARRATESGGKCHQRVKFRLDEFGNFPAIHDMASILTVCLGRNILFELYVQGYSQVTSKYGNEDGETIKENCQNHIYIKSTSKETNDEISAKCGVKTVTSTSRNRSGSDFNLEISETDTVEQVPLIEPSLLPRFVKGEQIILRFLTNEDLEHNAIRPDAIYNHNETATPFRFKYLGADFEPANKFADFEIPSEHRLIKLSDYRIDWKSTPEKAKVIKEGYIAKLEYFTEERKEEFINLCKSITNDYKLYERLLEVQSEIALPSTIQEVLMNKGMSDHEIISHQEEIINMVREIETYGETEEINSEDDLIFLSTHYFNEQSLNVVLTALKKDVSEDIYQELIYLGKNDYDARMKELEATNNLENLNKAISMARLKVS